jgi:hypothetical protein
MTTINVPEGPRYARLLSIGAYRPARVVTNDEIVKHIDSSDEWIRERSGIITRHFAAPDETVVDMGVAAAGKALANAGISGDQVGAVVVATVTHPYQTPSAAADIAHRLGAASAGAFDLSAACAGFCYGVALANDIIRGGTARYVVVIGVEKLSDFVDPTDRGSAFIFGDGAGAVVVGPSDVPAIGPTIWGSDGSALDAITNKHSWVQMQNDPELGWPWLTMQGQKGVPVGGLADGAGGRPGARGCRRRPWRSRRLHPAPGQHAHHRRHDQGTQAAAARARSHATSRRTCQQPRRHPSAGEATDVWSPVRPSAAAPCAAESGSAPASRTPAQVVTLP